MDFDIAMVFPIVMAVGVLTTIIGTYIHYSKKNKALPRPFQKDYLKNGLSFTQRIPFSLIKDSSLFPKKHPGLELLHGELFDRLYTEPPGSAEREALQLYFKYAKSSGRKLAYALEKCQRFYLNNGSSMASLTLHVAKNETFPNIRFHELFISTYTSLEEFCRELYTRLNPQQLQHSPLWQLGGGTFLYFNLRANHREPYHLEDFGQLKDKIGVRSVLYRYDQSYSPKSIFHHRPAIPSFIMKDVLPVAISREGDIAWDWFEAYLGASTNWFGLGKGIEKLLQHQGEEANFYHNFQDWESDIGQIILRHIQRHPTLENLRFLGSHRHSSKEVERIYRALKSTVSSMSGEITMTIEDSHGDLSEAEEFDKK